jgi:hypothetical protein
LESDWKDYWKNLAETIAVNGTKLSKKDILVKFLFYTTCKISKEEFSIVNQSLLFVKILEETKDGNFLTVSVEEPLIRQTFYNVLTQEENILALFAHYATQSSPSINILFVLSIKVAITSWNHPRKLLVPRQYGAMP